MAKQESRIALRLPLQERQQIEQLILKGKARNLSSVVRAALKEFLGKEVSEHG
jgi:Arc/MetJ-type ribon-helix-helix transcriptional regulator